jgi:mannitol-1-phosphate 5-dehydrogenase
MKKFLQYGAGNIGRGFIGPLFSQGGYEVTFIDIDRDVIDALNRYGRYPITIVSSATSEDCWVERVKGIDGRSSEAVALAMAECDLMAVSVGVAVLPKIVPAIAQGIRERIRRNADATLDILICENLIDADQYLHTLITQQLRGEEQEYFDRKVGLVETSIGRMVPIMTPELRKENILRVCVEAYGELPVDQAAFKGPVPDLPHLYPYTPFEFFIKRKLYVHNMGHSLAAYLGDLGGYDLIWQSIGNPVIKVIVQRAMTESSLALIHRFDIDPAALLDHVSHLLSRFSNVALGDTVARVGHDVRRKLAPLDRFAGALRLCSEERIPSFYIPVGIACALFFNDPSDPGLEEIKEGLKKNGIASVLEDDCGIGADSENFDVIKDYYQYLENNGNLEGLLKLAEEKHRENMSLRKII